MAAVLVVLLLVVVGVAGVLTFQKVQNHELTIPEHSETFLPSEDSSEPSGDNGTDGENSAEAVTLNRPDYMKGMYIKPGVDYLTGGRTSAADIQADLDAAFASVKELSMNTGLPYVDDTLEFDILEYASRKARENGLYIYVIYDLFTGVQDGSIVGLSQMDSASISDTVDHGLAIAQNYDIEGLMVDSYYNETQENSYLNYKLYGPAEPYGVPGAERGDPYRCAGQADRHAHRAGMGQQLHQRKRLGYYRFLHCQVQRQCR